MAMPYPGIEAFAAARESRDFYFPGPGKFRHRSWDEAAFSDMDEFEPPFDDPADGGTERT
ncbi:hypothetical protein [Paractinoplanes brasiliensis]|uniref:hypothetical protein n=1 Tax=Paractinoplanes brasiliensis TaxID=52695 RepID=UPI001061A3C8|nr:hypothetical protein [Actinoplanes brasiliensis]